MDKRELKQRLEELAGEVDDLADEVEEAEPSDLDDLADTEDLAAENMHLQAEVEILKQRIAALEQELAERGPCQPTPVSGTPLTPPGGRTTGSGLFG